MLKKFFKHLFSSEGNFEKKLIEDLKRYGFHILNTEKDIKNLFFRITKKGYTINLHINLKDLTGKVIINDRVICFRYKKNTDIVDELLKILNFLESSYDFRSFSFIENLKIYYNERKNQLESSYLYSKLSHSQLQSLQILNLKAENFLQRKCGFKN
jgi:hypothetical protein